VLDTVKFVEKVLVEFVNDEVDAREEKRARGVKGYWRALHIQTY